MVSECMGEKISISLVMRMQRKTPKKYHFISIRFTKINKPDHIKCGEDAGKWEFSSLLIV